MDILGIGPLELLFIILIALIVLGPKDMVKAGRTLGKLLRKIVTSPSWHAIQQTSRDLRYLPNRLIREAGLEDIKSQLPGEDELRVTLNSDNKEKGKEISQNDISDWITPPMTTSPSMQSTSRDPDLAQISDSSGHQEIMNDTNSK